MYTAEENPSSARDLPGHSIDIGTSKGASGALKCVAYTAMGGGKSSHSDKPLLTGKKKKKEKKERREAGGKHISSECQYQRKKLLLLHSNQAMTARHLIFQLIRS